MDAIKKNIIFLLLSLLFTPFLMLAQKSRYPKDTIYLMHKDTIFSNYKMKSKSDYVFKGKEGIKFW